MFIGIANSIGQRFGGGGVAPFIGLLDTYSGAAAAYSLRQLSSSYSGSAIRVRRSSDNTEQDIGFASNELDVTALASFCSGTNGFVTTWYDQSGNGNNAKQTTAASQPKVYDYITGVITDNGKPSVYFNGSTGQMTLGSLFTQQPFTIMGVNNLGLSSGILGDNNNGFFGHRASGEIILRTSVSLAYGSYPTSQNLFWGLANSTNSQIYMNGVFGVQGDAGNTYSGWVYLGYAGAYGTRPTGYISEIIAYNSDQSSNRTGIETNINNFYSIY